MAGDDPACDYDGIQRGAVVRSLGGDGDLLYSRLPLAGQATPPAGAPGCSCIVAVDVE